MRVGRVGTCDEEAFGVIDVFVATWRCVNSERLLVTRHCRRHTEARIGIDVVGADQALGEFIENIIILGQQLARNVESHAVWAVFANGGGEAFGEIVES